MKLRISWRVYPIRDSLAAGSYGIIMSLIKQAPSRPSACVSRRCRDTLSSRTFIKASLVDYVSSTPYCVHACPATPLHRYVFQKSQPGMINRELLLSGGSCGSIDGWNARLSERGHRIIFDDGLTFSGGMSGGFVNVDWWLGQVNFHV